MQHAAATAQQPVMAATMTGSTSPSCNMVVVVLLLLQVVVAVVVFLQRCRQRWTLRRMSWQPQSCCSRHGVQLG
jgi:hypothetical protein